MRWLVLALTAVTGFTGLAYEVTWQKYLGILLGAHSEATAAVLGLFLGGLSLGYWVLGAVLNVPYLAQGELDLLIRPRLIRWCLYVLLAFVTAYTIAVVRTAEIHAVALGEDLPSGKDVFGDGTAAHRLPQLIAIPAYLILVGGALWSAWRMRGRPELRDRFWGTLIIALGATVIAGFGPAFAALGYLIPFSISLLVGITVMFLGFARAARQRRPAPTG